MKFFNEDAKIKYGGRKAPKMSIDDLKEIIEETQFNKYKAVGAFDDIDDYSHKMTTLLRTIIDNDASVKKDIKYSFNTENLFANPADVDDKITGYHTLDNGFTFLGFCAGGDWEIGLYNIIYFDGKNLRLYQPTKGNAVNKKTKAAFGNDTDLDEEVLEKLGTDYDTALGNASDLYNEEAMLEEIEARIELTNTYISPAKKASRCINGDFVYTGEKLVAAKIDIDTLKTIIQHYYNEYEDIIEEYANYVDEWVDDDTRIHQRAVALAEICLDSMPEDEEPAADPTAMLRKDRIYEFVIDNPTVTADDWFDDDKAIGFNTLDNGFTYFGFYCSGDDDFGMFNIIYFDGNELRLYQPTKGNPVNTDTHRVIDFYDYEYAIKYGYDLGDDDCDEPDDLDQIDPSLTKCMEEIKDAFIVKDIPFDINKFK